MTTTPSIAFIIFFEGLYQDFTLSAISVPHSISDADHQFANFESMPSQIRAHRHGEFLPYIKVVIKERQGRKFGVLSIEKKRW
jgi:hypothetical protein